MNRYTKILSGIISLLFVSLLFMSCNPGILESQLGDWKREPDFAGVGRNGAVSFVIGDNAYVGLGYNQNKNAYLQDFWVFNSTSRTWAPIPSFPGPGRLNAVAFSLNGKGYVGTGQSGPDDSGTELSDFYCYDPVNKQWSSVAPLPNPPRKGATAFALKGLGYVGTGVYTSKTGNNIKNGLADFYSYDPKANAWKSIPGYQGPKVSGAFAFTIGNYAYMGGGVEVSTSSADNSFWRYDPDNLSWVKLPLLDSTTTNVKRFNCAYFANNGLGYVVCGRPNQQSTVYEFNPANNNYWLRKTDFEGPPRSDCVGFVLPSTSSGGYELFVGLGLADASIIPNSDFWSFNPVVKKILNN